MPFEIHKQNDLVWLTSPVLSGVHHAFSTRQGGVSAAPWDSLNLRTGCGDAPEALQENYRRFCAAVGTDVERTVLSRQVHETTVRVCTGADAGKGLLRERDYTADALANAASADKKRAGGDITLVIPRKIGACELRKMPVAELLPVITAGLEV